MSYTCPKCGKTTDDLACPDCDLIPELSAYPEARGLTRRQCYSVASIALLYLGQRDWRLVHGRVRNNQSPSEIIGHAWIERPGVGTFVDDKTGRTVEQPITVVWDLTQPDPRARLMPTSLYYDQVGVRLSPPPKRYTREQMIDEAYIFGHDGPWDVAGADRRPVGLARWGFPACPPHCDCEPAPLLGCNYPHCKLKVPE